MARPVILLAAALAAMLTGWLAARLSGTTPRSTLYLGLLVFPLLAGGVLVLAGQTVVFAVAAACALALAASAAILDWREGGIADGQTVGIALAGLVAAPTLHPYATWTLSLGGGALAAAILLLGNLIIFARTRRAGLGTGDYGLAAAGGLWCGLGWIGPALLVAVAVAAAPVVLGRSGMQDRLAFGPGLVIGFALATLAGRLF